MTSEGNELQDGLAHAGWVLAGAGYGDGCRNVEKLLRDFQPRRVFVSDKRDWDPANSGCFRKDVGFERLSALAEYKSVEKFCVVKDAGTLSEYQRAFVAECGARNAVVYYHRNSVVRQSPWLADLNLVRTYHSVDAGLCREAIEAAPEQRGRAILSGAVSDVYPMRKLVRAHAGSLGVEVLPHPGYGNVGASTPNYLRTLARYKVHVATASRYGFALRKIIESVAVGCTPVTDLPEYDVLPEIDGALVRVQTTATVDDIRAAIDAAERNWDPDERLAYSRAAIERYDWREIGRRLSLNLVETAR